MGIDLVRFRDWLTRAQKASEQALQRGDIGAAQAYQKMLDQANQVVEQQIAPQMNKPSGGGGYGFYNYMDNDMYSGAQQAPPPQGPSGAEPNPADEAGFLSPPRQGKPIVDPVAELREQQAAGVPFLGPTSPIAKDAQQETGSSWTDLIFGRGPAAASRQFGGTPPPKLQEPPTKAIDTSTTPIMDFMTKPLWGDRDLLFNQKEQKDAYKAATDWLTEPRWFKEPKGGAYWDVLGEKRPKDATQPMPPAEPQAQEGGDLFSPSTPTPFEKQPNADPFQGATKAGVDDATPNSDTGLEGFTGGKKGDNKHSFGFEDFLGLLIGGRNYLRYKQGQEQRLDDREFMTQRDEARRAEQARELEQTLGMREKALAVEYAKSLADAQAKAAQREGAEYNNVIRAFATPGANTSDPLLKEAGNRARAIQLKRNQN